MNLDTVLIVEDDVVDVMAIKRVFKELSIDKRLVIKSNGVEALDYLMDTAQPKPVLVVLDINMPKMNGIEFLKKMKGDFEMKHIPVVILTTSKQSSDRIDTYQNGAAGYLVKPVDYDEFKEKMKVVMTYWKFCESASLKME